MMSGAAGPSAYWWWDNYVEPKGLLREFAPIAKFVAPIDWANTRFEPLRAAQPHRANVNTESYSDLVLYPFLGWGKSHGETIELSPGGQPSNGLPGYIYGLRKPEMRTPTRIQVEMPNDGQMIVRVREVSDSSILRVAIDGKDVADFPFSALPGSPDVQSTELHPEHENIYQAKIDKDRAVPIPAGRHTVTLDNLGPDWVSIASITFTGAKSARFADLGALAMRDAQSGQTVMWLYDALSNWKSDKDGLSPRTLDDVVVELPAASISRYSIQWWDTRKGEVIRTDEVTAEDGKLKLQPPAWSRDIAARVRTSEK